MASNGIDWQFAPKQETPVEDTGEVKSVLEFSVDDSGELVSLEPQFSLALEPEPKPKPKKKAKKKNTNHINDGDMKCNWNGKPVVWGDLSDAFAVNFVEKKKKKINPKKKKAQKTKGVNYEYAHTYQVGGPEFNELVVAQGKFLTAMEAAAHKNKQKFIDAVDNKIKSDYKTAALAQAYGGNPLSGKEMFDVLKNPPAVDPGAAPPTLKHYPVVHGNPNSMETFYSSFGMDSLTEDMCKTKGELNYKLEQECEKAAKQLAVMMLKEGYIKIHKLGKNMEYDETQYRLSVKVLKPNFPMSGF